MNDDLDPNLDLAEQVLQLLQAAPDGIAEYTLIQQLKDRHSGHVPNLPLADKLVLFRTHFLLFNALYRLRERLWQEQTHLLEISPLCIRLLPYQPGNAALSERDALCDYYLDMNNLEGTDERDVERLLTSFWTRMQGGEEKQAALELFELANERTLDLPRIKLRYRKMVSAHHPDRGGSTERLQSINLAMEILERYYR
ncbi:DNA-J related domain-containing protein [Ectopseudomonas oleovorans]|uniref:Mitochondrial import inner membrane translocase subunit tim14 n=1 Tax=Ectopseudomonas oleovorans (strain CECT 5344) TaxID=1182590 RepID=W6QWU2_ECTO5|nr:DNA-J related domain-containing protein [Pseudomonas oleovorans]CDM41325.1 Mitochondrial import inner membrane translocase subunit tim14 [Pseudomonas oleovorans CECT 5344]CDR91953.1 Mitochondrial import inner membrane translocase subunit tim14 [Pseudomonas oleovorans]